METRLNDSRRNFLKTASVAGAMALAPGELFAASGPAGKETKITLSKGNVILFQGDSITDSGRRKDTLTPNNPAALGTGYAFLAASALLSRYPGLNLRIYNRGISGNKVYQLADRWDKDCLELKPDVLSILVGVNDYWHKHDKKYDGTVQTYRDDYIRLLERTRKTLPDVKLIVAEPYAVKGVRAVDDTWYPEFNEFREASAAIARQFNAVYLPYQRIFDEAQKKAPGAYWTADGVHPSIAGAERMATAWLELIKA
jgi:lysophospholipase L1-like esterase